MFITDKVEKSSRYHIKVSYWIPSTKAWGRSASWHLVEIITALARIRVNDNLPKSWLVTTLSATPLHLASAAASCLAVAEIGFAYRAIYCNFVVMLGLRSNFQNFLTEWSPTLTPTFYCSSGIEELCHDFSGKHLIVYKMNFTMKAMCSFFSWETQWWFAWAAPPKKLIDWSKIVWSMMKTTFHDDRVREHCLLYVGFAIVVTT